MTWNADVAFGPPTPKKIRTVSPTLAFIGCSAVSASTAPLKTKYSARSASNFSTLNSSWPRCVGSPGRGDRQAPEGRGRRRRKLCLPDGMAPRRGVLALVESGRLARGLRTARARHDEERRGACLPDHPV